MCERSKQIPGDRGGFCAMACWGCANEVSKSQVREVNLCAVLAGDVRALASKSQVIEGDVPKNCLYLPDR